MAACNDRPGSPDPGTVDINWQRGNEHEFRVARDSDKQLLRIQQGLGYDPCTPVYT